MLNQERADFVIRLAQKMVQCSSLSGQEGDLARLVRQTMEHLGYDEIGTDRYGNVIGKIDFGRPGKTILLEGHMDHVDPGDLSKWTVDPYGESYRTGNSMAAGLLI